MSMYSRLFGENKDATILLGMAGTTREFFLRYRDVYLNPEADIITVLTRLGGDNRKHYKEIFNQIKSNPNYIRNYDDDFDETYCYFEFKVPDKYKDACKHMAPKEKVLTVGDKFKKETEEAQIPGTPAYKRSEELLNWIIYNMENGNHMIGL